MSSKGPNFGPKMWRNSQAVTGTVPVGNSQSAFCLETFALGILVFLECLMFSGIRRYTPYRWIVLYGMLQTKCVANLVLKNRTPQKSMKNLR